MTTQQKLKKLLESEGEEEEQQGNSIVKNPE